MNRFDLMSPEEIKEELRLLRDALRALEQINARWSVAAQESILADICVFVRHLLEVDEAEAIHEILSAE